VVQPAKRNGEFVAYLAAESEPLGEAHVVRLGRLPPANEAGSGSDVLEMIFITKAPRFPEGEDALVDAVRGAFLRLRSHALVARFHRLGAGFSGVNGCRRPRLCLLHLFFKRRNSKCEGGLDEPGVARNQGVFYGQDVAGPLRCSLGRRQFNDSRSSRSRASAEASGSRMGRCPARRQEGLVEARSDGVEPGLPPAPAPGWQFRSGASRSSSPAMPTNVKSAYRRA